jgi:hypothetical protein
MAPYDLSRAIWHKGSYSRQSGNCLEVAANLDGVVGVRTPRTRMGRGWSSAPRSGGVHKGTHQLTLREPAQRPLHKAPQWFHAAPALRAGQ